MHSVVDWCAFAVWELDGTVRRALSLSPDSEHVEILEGIYSTVTGPGQGDPCSGFRVGWR